MLHLPKAYQFGFVLLLGGNAEDAGIADLPRAQLLEQRISTVGRCDDLTALESDPLALKPLEYLG
jgi:hypothetical protein